MSHIDLLQFLTNLRPVPIRKEEVNGSMTWASEGWPVVRFHYTNYEGKKSVRRIAPYPFLIDFGSNHYHPTPGWLLQVTDLDRAAIRTFSVADMEGIEEEKK